MKVSIMYFHAYYEVYISSFGIVLVYSTANPALWVGVVFEVCCGVCAPLQDFPWERWLEHRFFHRVGDWSTVEKSLCHDDDPKDKDPKE